MPHFLSGSDKFPFIAQGSRWEFCFISVEGAVALANIFAGRQPRFMPKWHRN